VRYHQPASLVPVTLSPELRATVSTAIERARLLRREGKRPPVTTEERRCAKCSLAPLCLPEEERVADGAVPRLFPEDDVRQIVHVTTAGARVGKSAQQLKVTLDGEPDVLLPVQQVSALVLHGAVQVSAQALTFLSHEGIGVHWFTGAGDYVGGLASQTGSVHRRVRQFEALRDPVQRNALAQRLVSAKVEHQLRFLLRASRDAEASRAAIAPAVRDLRQCLVGVRHTQEPASLLGLEGAAAARYFSALPSLQREGLDPRLLWTGRSRRPPMDRFNALLSFFYGLVQRDVEAAILAVGLDPAFGLYHQPRGTVGPLVLDVMELFRVPLADMPVMASINRQTWDCEADFDVATSAGEVARVWLSADGRRKAIEVYERRRRETWKHSVLGYSLSYARLMELEVRLLEKEWLGRAGLFASFRLR
jgi:CRISPR-associated protein Cas1